MVTFVPLGSMPSVLRAFAGVLIRRPQTVQPLPPFKTRGDVVHAVRLDQPRVVLRSPVVLGRGGQVPPRDALADQVEVAAPVDEPLAGAALRAHDPGVGAVDRDERLAPAAAAGDGAAGGLA